MTRGGELADCYQDLEGKCEEEYQSQCHLNEILDELYIESNVAVKVNLSLSKSEVIHE